MIFHGYEKEKMIFDIHQKKEKDFILFLNFFQMEDSIREQQKKGTTILINGNWLIRHIPTF